MLCNQGLTLIMSSPLVSASHVLGWSLHPFAGLFNYFATNLLVLYYNKISFGPSMLVNHRDLTCAHFPSAVWQSATEVSGAAAAPQVLIFSSVFVREAVCCCDTAVKPSEERA